MRVQIYVVLLCSLLCISSVYAQEGNPELEIISAENAKWLVPLEIVGAGPVIETFWMENGAKLAVVSQTGIYIYETAEHDGTVQILPDSEIYYDGLGRVVNDPGFQLFFALDRLEDRRADRPLQANIWNLRTGEVLGTLTNVERLDALSPDGETAAVVRESTLELYSTRTGERVSVLALPSPVNQYGANFSYDGRYLIVGGAWSTIDGWVLGFMLIYDMIEQVLIVESEEDANIVGYGLVFSPDGRYITNRFGDGFWEFDAETRSITFLGEDGAALGMERITHSHHFEEGSEYSDNAFEWRYKLPDGTDWQMSRSYLPNDYFTGDSRYNTVMMAIGDGEVSSFRPPSVLGTAFSPDGQTLYYSSPYRSILEETSIMGVNLEARSYDLSQQETGFWDLEGNFFFSRFRPHGENYYQLLAFDLRRDESLVDSHLGERYDFAISADGEHIAWNRGISDERTEPDTAVLNMETGEIQSFGWLENLRLSDDGTYLAGLEDNWKLKIFDVSTGELHMRYPGPFDLTLGYSVAFSPDNRYFVFYQSQNIRILDLETEEILHRIILPEHMRGGLVFSQDGRWLMLGSGEAQYLWRIEDLPEHLEADTADLNIHFVEADKAFYLESSSETNSLVRWQYQDGILRLIINDTEQAAFFVTPWSTFVLPSYEGYDYRTNLRYANPELRYEDRYIYEAASGEFLNTIQLASPTPSQISLSPDGRMIAMSDGRLAIWGVPVIPTEPNSVICPNAPAPQLSVGLEAIVTATTGPRELRIRTYPNGIIESSAPSGTVLTVERGPICANGLLWWGIRNEEIGVHGWSAEAITANDYLLQSINE